MITKFDEYIREGIISDRYTDEDDNYSGVMSSHFKHASDEYADEDEDDNYSGVMSSHFKHASDEYKNDDERNLLSFSYKGNKLPTEEMINWFNDEERVKMEEYFFDDFHDELMNLSYMEMLDVFKKASEQANL